MFLTIILKTFYFSVIGEFLNIHPKKLIEATSSYEEPVSTLQLRKYKG